MRNKILVVEDDKDLAFVIRTALKEGGYSVQVAYDGVEALENMFEETPDLIILDLMLPRMDGYLVNTKLKQDSQTAEIPVIILTAYSHRKQFSRMKKDANIAAYLEKPTPMKEILAVVERVLKPKE